METEIHDVLDRLRESETIGESVLRDRSEIVQLDRIRQKNREALTALKKSDPNDSIYLCIGNMFIKHHNQRAQSLIQQEQKQIDEHLEKLYKQVKDNVGELQKLENSYGSFDSFNLKSMSTNEMKSINVILDQVKKLDL